MNENVQNKKETNVLGQFWDKENGMIGLKRKAHKVPEKMTKREILRFIASVWDLLGLLGPVMTSLRIT